MEMDYKAYRDYIREEYKDMLLLGYILYFKNEEVNSDLQREWTKNGGRVEEKPLTFPSFQEFMNNPEKRKPSLHSQLWEGEREKYLARDGEVRDALRPYIRMKLEQLVDSEEGNAMADEVKKNGLETVVDEVLDFAVIYAAEQRQEKGGYLQEIREDGKSYPLQGEARVKALARIQEPYAPNEDSKETLSVWEPYERLIVLQAPELITVVDTTVALAIKYPRNEYKAYVEEQIEK